MDKGYNEKPHMRVNKITYYTNWKSNNSKCLVQTIDEDMVYLMVYWVVSVSLCTMYSVELTESEIAVCEKNQGYMQTSPQDINCA